MAVASTLSSDEEEEESTDDEEEKHRFVRLPIAHGHADGESSSSESESDTETQEEEVQPTQVKKTTPSPHIPLPVSSVAAADDSDDSSDDDDDEDSGGAGSPKSIGQIVAANRKPLRYENGTGGAPQKRFREEAPEEEEDSSDEAPLKKKKKDKKKKKNANGDDESVLVEAKKTEATATVASSSSKKELGMKIAVGSVEKEKGGKLSQASKEDLTTAVATSKKKPHVPVWTPINELAFVTFLVSYVKSGNRIPGQNDEFWDLTSEALEIGFTGKQLYNKLRGMKLKYRSFLDGTKPLPKSPHEDSLFKMWRRIWGNEGGGGTATTDTEVEHPKPNKTQQQQLPNSDINTKDSIAKQSKKSSSKHPKTVVKSSPLPPTPSSLPPKPEEEKYSLKTEQEQFESKLKPNTEMVSVSIGRKEEKPTEDLQSLGKNLTEELKSSCTCNSAQTVNHSFMLDELRSSYSKLLQEVESKCVAAVESVLSSIRWNNKNSQGCWGGGMMSPCSSSSFPCIGNVLDMNVSDGDLLKQQWDKQRLLELKAFSKRLELMQEQCRLQQEQLKLQLGVDKLQ